MRVELTDGAWAEIAEVSELRDKDRKAVNKAAVLQIDPETQKAVIPGDMDDNMLDALLRRILTAWSFENLPLPSNDPQFPAESLDRLSIQDARLLHEAVRPHMKLITANDSPTKRADTPAQS